MDVAWTVVKIVFQLTMFFFSLVGISYVFGQKVNIKRSIILTNVLAVVAFAVSYINLKWM